MCGLWWIKRQWDQLCTEHFGFPCHYQYCNAPFSCHSTTPDAGVKYKTSLFLSKISKFQQQMSDSSELRVYSLPRRTRPVLQMPQCHFMYSDTTAHSIATDIQTYLSPKAAVYVSVGYIKLSLWPPQNTNFTFYFLSHLSVYLIAFLFVFVSKVGLK